MKARPSDTIGNLIKIIRKTQGMSQMKLAEKLGVSYQQVQKYENGTTNITLTRLAQIAKALDIPAQTLITADPTISADKSNELSDKELRLLMLFRKLKSEKSKNAFLTILEDMAEISLRR